MLTKLIQSSRMRLPVCFLAAASLLISSCASPTGGIAGVGSSGVIGPLNYDGQERQIIDQARVGGALLGAAAGYFIAKESGGNRLGGAALGGLVGGLAGDAVGKGQANQAKQARLSNDSLRNAIASARKNNDRLEAYNRKVAARIAELRRKPAAERASLAKAELKDVDSSLKSTQSYTSSRSAAKSKMPPTQASQYASETRRGEREQARLASYRSELAKMSVASN
ncbi:MAG: hypothetical protein HC845_05010 [Akkermansiaceae bacterium]|nr:hypothetical protein [Akkermansiaceae bacterium]